MIPYVKMTEALHKSIQDRLRFESKTLDQALNQARRMQFADATLTGTNVYLAEPVDEWQRVKDLRKGE